MIPKLSGACYAVGFMAHISNINTHKSIYSPHFHYIIKYGIIFWGNSSNSGKIFILQNKIFRIVAGAYILVMSVYTSINELHCH